MLSFLKPRGAAVGRISAADAIQKAAAGEITLIDVRDAGEIRASGKAKGALHIPMSRLAMVTDPKSPDFDKRLKTDKPVVLYCASGARSQMGGQRMAGLGYASVFNLGGFREWVSAGGPVER
ncbi:MAG: rhodanese-like domain-containing protein [Allgaiera sp.]|jgi:rhodanese-related sulfurtransferase|nr:rhodanese-like domain-containing protein [Allgaiera sp.]